MNVKQRTLNLRAHRSSCRVPYGNLDDHYLWVPSVPTLEAFWILDHEAVMSQHRQQPVSGRHSRPQCRARLRHPHLFLLGDHEQQAQNVVDRSDRISWPGGDRLYRVYGVEALGAHKPNCMRWNVLSELSRLVRGGAPAPMFVPEVS